MKQKFLKWIYLKYRSYFYNFLTEEFLEDIPKSVREPSMKFLSQGRDKLEKWALYQAHFLQTRMVMDVDKIKTYEGMMLMLKLLLVHVKQAPSVVAVVGEPEEKVNDPIQEVEEAIAAFKKPKEQVVDN